MVHYSYNKVSFPWLWQLLLHLHHVVDQHVAAGVLCEGGDQDHLQDAEQAVQG